MNRGTTRACVVFVALNCPFLLRGSAEPPKTDAPLELTADEKELLELTNAARAKKKLPPLAPSPILVKVARAHSANMAKKKDLNHILDGKNPGQRTLQGGYDYGLIGENIAFASDGGSLKDVMDGWMESKHHRDNILKNTFVEIGIGIATNGDGESYYTQVFAKPRKKR